MEMSQVCNNPAEIAATITVRIIKIFQALELQSSESGMVNPSETQVGPFTPLTNPPTCPVNRVKATATISTASRRPGELQFGLLCSRMCSQQTSQISTLEHRAKIMCNFRFPFGPLPSNCNCQARRPVRTVGTAAIAAAISVEC